MRERRAADLEGAAAALVRVYASDGYPVEGVDDPRAWLRPADLLHAWVAEVDGEIVGHAVLTAPVDSADGADGADAVRIWREQAPDERVAVLGRLFVLPEARGYALGERLARAAMEFAEAQGLRLVLDVVDKDVAAIRLYERLGWQRIGTADHRFGDGRSITAYCYVAPLPAGSA
ncbi:GNAT family N-acetyltransferase [Amycolatopsis magusensis]|uniref:GNAT family N-acetyltransferase n=1 Tax=Amycolatopsis magusensis TaxID=882444 RepID=UPI003788C455